MIGSFRHRTRLGSGIYQTGRERVIQILDVALEILLESGYQALTLREVARRCHIRVGAVSYYYTSPNDLLLDVINMVLVPYADNFRAIREEPDLTAEQRLERLRVLRKTSEQAHNVSSPISDVAITTPATQRRDSVTPRTTDATSLSPNNPRLRKAARDSCRVCRRVSRGFDYVVRIRKGRPRTDALHACLSGASRVGAHHHT